MPRAQTKLLPLLALLLAAAAAPAQGQSPKPAAAGQGIQIEYRREVFGYDRRGRPDPFRPLLTPGDLGIRLEDLRLRGVVYNPNPRLSVAVFAQADTGRSIRLRVGQRYGNLTVVGIYPRRVDVRVDEFGQSRVESVPLKRQPFVEQPGGAPAPAAAPPQEATAAAAPAGPLRTRQAQQRQQAREAQQQTQAPQRLQQQTQQPQRSGRPNQ